MMDLRGNSTIASLICSGVTLWTALTQHTTQARCQSPKVEVLFRWLRRRILILIQGIPGILLQLDFQNSFDTIEWKCIQNAIALFNFGESIQRWISTSTLISITQT